MTTLLHMQKNFSMDTMMDMTTMVTVNEATSGSVPAGSILDSVPSSKRPPIDIVSLYYNDMNIYGDTGNLLIMARRLYLKGFEPIIHPYNPGDEWPEHADVILGGGGQDSGQRNIQSDLHMRAGLLRDLASKDIPMLMICGMYQLFGKSFETIGGDIIPGISVFDAVTIGKKERLVGNLVENSARFGTLAGYENHSGQTYLSGTTVPLGNVRSGVGNNSEEKTEGAVFHNVIGTYMHGPILSKNPGVADFLIHSAVDNRYGEGAFQQVHEDGVELDKLNVLAAKAREIAITRPR